MLARELEQEAITAEACGFLNPELVLQRVLSHIQALAEEWQPQLSDVFGQCFRLGC